jgi:hypothetical protein
VDAEDHFFMKAANIEIQFTGNKAGRTTGLVLHSGRQANDCHAPIAVRIYGNLGLMNIEETMKIILESQVRAEARAEKADARSEKADARADRADARMDRMEKKSEREMAAIRKLLHQGMKSLAELTESQKETDRALKAFIKSLSNGRRRNGMNGH